ncbi:hypothetical protein KCH_27740 [Kitasatospora cheerisanensis KCTC 2395]|uniref:Uncharacterized protein n=1 Tax=Kitasatospora cheerisanensis KCTC 2395 TaxID=1348663 RepID=A0A066YVG5_9ACTN|nr:hypothetical protein KCH_27740 [Kitasatospora cheerisanensis KCTC 2395]
MAPSATKSARSGGFRPRAPDPGARRGRDKSVARARTG